MPPPNDDPNRQHRLEQVSVNFSLVRGDLAWRLQRRVGLIPVEGMGAGRRALFFAALTWLPIAAGAWWAAQQGAHPAEPLLAHYGVHVRCLLAIPMMVLAEGLAHQVLPRILAQFEVAGVVREGDRARFHAVLDDVAQLRDSTLPWALILGAVLAWSTTAIFQGNFSEVDWQRNARETIRTVGFSAWWFAAVARPVFIAMLLGWLWRTLLLGILLRRLSRLALCIVPGHPDRRGGLAFMERLALIFAPVSFAVSAVTAATFAHEVVYHGVNVMDIKFELAGTAILVTLLFLLPFLPLTPVLVRVKREAMLDYGALVARHERLVHARWILGESIAQDPILDAPELGALADVHQTYEAVEAMRTRAIDRFGLFAIGAPAVLPVLCVALIQIPLDEIFGSMVKALM